MLRLSIAAEKLGIPSVSVMAPMFQKQAQAVARGLGLPGINLALYPGAIETHSDDELRANVEALFDTMVAAWTRPVAAESAQRQGAEDAAGGARDPARIVFSGDLDQVDAHFYARGWTDGLPIVPPTAERVRAMLAHTDLPPDEPIAVLPIANLQATPRNIAVNAVMAGCRPEYLPVLIAAVEAIADPVYQLKDVNSTASIKPFIVVNGPVARQLDINCDTSLMAPGRRSNSTIGRALGLIVRNIAGFREGETSMGTFGWPGSPWVMAEHEDLSPWPPYHVDQGFDAGTSTVTAMMMMNMTYQAMTAGDTAEPHLTGLCTQLTQTFGATFVLLGAEHGSIFVFISPPNARVIARDGYTKRAVSEHLAANARLTVREIDEHFRFTFSDNQDTIHSLAMAGRVPREWDRGPDERIPFVPTPDMIHVVVCGSAQRNRNLVMRASYCTPVTRAIRLPKRWNPESFERTTAPTGDHR